MKNLFLCALVVGLSCGLALGQTQYKVLWTFSGAPSDGALPEGSLVFDKAGNLYGTTVSGGSSSSSFCFGCGTAFKLSPNSDGSWTNTILYSFCANYVKQQCLDGVSPMAGLVFDSQGNLYGTTSEGGNACSFDGRGCGTVFELSPPSLPGGSWSETVLYAFCANQVNNQCIDGAAPVSQLVFDRSGNLYGTTRTGGSGFNATGTVFELSRSAGGWIQTVLYTFCSGGTFPVCPDGDQPQAGVAFDNVGNLYGTTELGGSQKSEGGGTVYELSPSPTGWTETVLYFFLPPFKAGGSPVGTVTFDILGNLYSTFTGGGQNEGGGVFRLTPKNGGKVRTFSFDGRDGFSPVAGVLVDSRHAVVYGTTKGGGTSDGGTVFKITAPAQETVLYNFCLQTNCTDGAGPVASLVADSSGNLYGTTKVGGDLNGNGVVFELIQ